MREDLFKILCCPLCHSQLEFQPEEIICTGCGEKYFWQEDKSPVLISRSELKRYSEKKQTKKNILIFS